MGLSPILPKRKMSYSCCTIKNMENFMDPQYAFLCATNKANKR